MAMDLDGCNQISSEGKIPFQGIKFVDCEVEVEVRFTL